MNSIFYPKTMDDLEKLISYFKKIYQEDNNLEEFLKWEKWYKKVKHKIIINLEEDEFLKISFKNDGHFSLEVWKKGINYNYICYNLASNNYNEFNNESTVIENS